MAETGMNFEYETMRVEDHGEGLLLAALNRPRSPMR